MAAFLSLLLLVSGVDDQPKKQNDPAVQCVADRVPAAAATDRPASVLAAQIELRCEEHLPDQCGDLSDPSYKRLCRDSRLRMRESLRTMAYNLIRIHRGE